MMFFSLQVAPSEFQAVLKELGMDWKMWQVVLCLVLFGLLCWCVRYYFKRRYKAHKWKKDKMKAISNTDFRDYLPFKKKHLYIPAMCQSKAPSDYPDPIDATIAETREKLLDKMYDVLSDKNAKNNLFCILAGAGMGKSSFLVYLYRKMVSKKLDGTGHNIAILSLVQTDVLEKIACIEDKENVILLLDALDENVEAMNDFETFWDKLLLGVKDFNRVVITCRTQFFSSADSEPNFTNLSSYMSNKGVRAFIRFYISPFKDSERRLYVKKKYKWYHPMKRRKALKVIEQNDSLMSRPLLIANIDNLIDSERKYRYGFQIYEALIESWATREADRQKLYGKDKENFVRQIPMISKDAAFLLYENLDNNTACTMSKGQLDEFEKLHPLHNAKLTLNSLFNRDVKGNWKFSHKSFFEYFLSEIAFQNWDKVPNLNKFDMGMEFYRQRCIAEYDKFSVKNKCWRISSIGVINNFTMLLWPESFHPMHLISVLNDKNISVLTIRGGFFDVFDLLTKQFLRALKTTYVEIVEFAVLHSSDIPSDLLEDSNLLMLIIDCQEQVSVKFKKNAAKVGFKCNEMPDSRQTVFYRNASKGFANPIFSYYYPRNLSLPDSLFRTRIEYLKNNKKE